MGDGGCVITGDNNYSIKLNSSGSIVWAKFYGGEGIELYDIIKTSDGGYIACGESFDVNNFTSNGYLMKLDLIGNLQWQQTYLTNDLRIFNSIKEIPNGQYILTGTDSDFFGDTVKIMFLKLNSNGGIILDLEYTILGKGGNGFKINNFNNQYLIGGSTSDTTGTKTNNCFLRIDTSGNILFVKKYEAGRNEGFYDMQVINPNKYIFTRTRSIGINLESYVMIIDSLGNEITGRSFYLNDFVIFRTILPMANGDFVIAGNGMLNSQSEYKTYIVRTDSLLYAPPISVVNISGNIPHDFKLKQNFPNPFNPVTNIKFLIPSAGQKHTYDVLIKVYDALGREVFAYRDTKQAGTYEIQFDGTNLASGLYFYSMEINPSSGSGRVFKDTKKMVLLK